MNGKDNSTSPGRRARTAGPGALGLREDGSRHAAPTPYSGSPCAKAPHPRPGQGRWKASVHISPRSAEGPLQPGQRRRRAPTLSRPRSVKGSSTRPRSMEGPPATRPRSMEGRPPAQGQWRVPLTRPRAVEGPPTSSKAVGGPPNQPKGSGGPLLLKNVVQKLIYERPPSRL